MKWLFFASMSFLPWIWFDEERVSQYLSQAEGFSESGESEIAASYLRRAQILINEGDVSSGLSRRVTDLMRKTDPIDVVRRKEFNRAAKSLLKVAKAYEDVKWYDSALEVLEIAHALDSKEVGGLLTKMEGLIARSSLDRASFGGDMFKRATQVFGTGEWTARLDELVSPQLPERVETQCLLSQVSVEGNNEFRFEVKLGGEPSKVGMVIGFDSHELPCYLIEFNQKPEARELRIFEQKHAQLEWISGVEQVGSADELPEWVAFSIRWNDETIVAQCGTMTLEEPRAGKDLGGHFGPFISGDSPKKTPVRFRGLEIRDN